MEKLSTNNKQSSTILVECPRDAMQGWHRFIPTKDKIRYINALLKVGFNTIDFGSFVSPKAIPQMADTKEVIAKLELQNTRSKLLAIVANTRGAAEAVVFDEIAFLGFPFSISPTFQQRNTNSTMAESLVRVEEIQALCLKNNKQLVLYLSMGFGNPYSDVYNQEILLQWAAEMAARDITIISLADTIGLANPKQITDALQVLIPTYKNINFGVHLHSTQSSFQPKLQAAIAAGCQRFDGALKGIGGCPMAQDDLVGNMPTELMINYLETQGLLTALDKNALQESLLIATEIFS